MKIQYDKIADAMYVCLGVKKKVVKTIEVNDRLLVDMDKSGHIVGIEILDASSGKGIQNLAKSVKSGVPVELISGALATA